MAIVKLLHLFAVFLWVGGLLMLMRFLFAAPGATAQLLKRIYFRVHAPLILVAVGCGIALILVNGADWKAPWLHMKLTFVFLFLLCDLYIGRRIYLNSKGVVKGGAGIRVAQVLATLFFIGILIAIYILKP